MKIISDKNQTSKNAMSLSTADLLESSSLSEFLSLNEQQLSYHEMEEIPVRGVDIVEQLAANVVCLADLSQRLRFLNKEIRYLLKA